MPFNRIFDPDTNAYIISRDFTGPPPAPETGVIVEESGAVTADSPDINIAPATPVKVNLPGPRERVIDASGNISPRWYRFFQELYRRTGGYVDNINNTDRYVAGAQSSTTGSLVLSGIAPTVLLDALPPAGSLSLSSAAPTIT